MNYDMKPILENFALLAEVGNPRGCDPEERTTDDSIFDAQGMIAYAAQSATVGMKEVLVDDECIGEVQGDTVLFSMPAITVRVSRVQDADLMASWACARWLEAVGAAREAARV
jgi:hypothetical protein